MKNVSECRKTVLAAAIGSFVFAFGASAGDDKMQMMDTNKDGMISAAEHSAGVKQMFTKMDVDGDGKVTAAEMDASHRRMSGGSVWRHEHVLGRQDQDHGYKWRWNDHGG